MKTTAILCFASLATAARAFVPAGRSIRALPTAAYASPLDTLFAVLKGGKVGLVKSLAGEYDAAAIRDKMDGLVKDNPILDEKGAKYTVVELDEEADGKAIRAEMGDMLGRTSVPAIWIDSTFIGGCKTGHWVASTT
ncbi:hypothetical protein ACHAXT_004194 [Thalassiosira profunda]